MAHRGHRLTLQERVAIQHGAPAGQSDAAIAVALQCSRWTVRKWRRRAAQSGQVEPAPRIGRPSTGALSTLPPTLQTLICTLRQQHPGWGPSSILATLHVHPLWSGQPLPSRSRIAAFLKQQGLVKPHQRRTTLPQPPPTTAYVPHEEWELDAEGAVRVDSLGSVSLITILDVVSRVKIERYPCLARTPATEDYQLALRRAFLSFGLPQRISLDHDGAFFANPSPSPFPSLLHLWLVALGVGVRFIRLRPPQDHAKIERTHQTMERQVFHGQRWTDQAALWQELDQRRAILNHILPMQVLGGRAPLQAYPTAVHSGRLYQPQWEAELLDLHQVGAYLAQGEWFRRSNAGGMFAVAKQYYYLGKQVGQPTVHITCDPTTLEFICQPEGMTEQFRRPIVQLTKEALLGELARFHEIPAYQLMLPFEPAAWRQLIYTHLMARAPQPSAGRPDPAEITNGTTPDCGGAAELSAARIDPLQGPRQKKRLLSLRTSVRSGGLGNL